ncbi:hypothetical protein DL769_008021 [Monosporascus sp. CRB-8-3]|nr:hypothetical protein DL769_008021 [Monosporascus sp. CRB-8-3]
MQFTTSLISLLPAASSAQALPGSSVEARQEPRIVHAEYYDRTDCGGTFLGEQVFVEDQVRTCIDINIPCDGRLHMDHLQQRLASPIAGSNFFTVPPGGTGFFGDQDVEAAQFQ